MKLIQERAPLWLLILIGLCALLTILIIAFFSIENMKTAGLVGGIVGGLVIYIANFLSETWALRKLFEYQRMGIRNILANRHDRIYYKKILSGTSEESKNNGCILLPLY